MMKKTFGMICAVLLLSTMVTGCASQFRVKKKPPKQSKIGFLDFKKAHCGCVGK